MGMNAINYVPACQSLLDIMHNGLDLIGQAAPVGVTKDQALGTCLVGCGERLNCITPIFFKSVKKMLGIVMGFQSSLYEECNTVSDGIKILLGGCRKLIFHMVRIGLSKNCTHQGSRFDNRN